MIKVILPKTITKLSTYVFCNCKSLKDIIIPAEVSSIYSNCFTGCGSLENIYVAPDVVISIQPKS